MLKYVKSNFNPFFLLRFGETKTIFMKREILFKAKRVDNGEWVYGNLYIPNQMLRGVYISLDTTCVNMIPDLDGEDNITKEQIDSHEGIMIGKFIEVNPETVCQFTGLLDKNGKKIFEGDYDQNYEVVKWCEKRMGYSLFVYDHPTKEFIHCNCYSCSGHYELSEVINQIEIISNIHD